MFSPEIVESEEFLSLPISSQALYFHLAMSADDDGFIQPKKIMRLVGSSEDDLRVLLAKRFLLSFESGVVVIKHWLIHNLIRHDRYKPTRFQEEKKSLLIKENKSYSDGLQNGNQLATQVRLGKVRLGKDTTSETSSEEIPLLIKSFEAINPNAKNFYGRPPQRKACEQLISNYGFDRVKTVIEKTLPITNKMAYMPTITTPIQLLEKWSSLEAGIIKIKNKEPKYKVAF